jgi:hypothetical protein
VLPIGCAILASELVAIPRRWVHLAAAATFVLVATFWVPPSLHMLNFYGGLPELEDQRVLTERVTRLADELKGMPEGRVAIISIGVVGYRSGRNILDLVGLTDKHIARTPHVPGAMPGHDHGDADYVLEQRPEFAVFMPLLTVGPVSTSDEAAFLNKADGYYHAARVLQEDPRFRAAYTPLDKVVTNGRHFRIWIRNR